MVRLQSGDFSAAEGDALERWKALSSEHAEVFRQLLGSLAPLQDSPWRGQPSATVLRALEQPSSRRRFVGGRPRAVRPARRRRRPGALGPGRHGSARRTGDRHRRASRLVAGRRQPPCA
ncbi:FecR/PupR family sigma factor regulator [Pseudomonas aeruginosa]|uniref:FecR/PupR family sigma factor regulator n=1 Tax=Pseudomonas aeruginosa TaxID=287 RepID=UPI003D29D6F6